MSTVYNRKHVAWCKISADSQSHMMECHILVNCVPELRNNIAVKYDDILKNAFEWKKLVY